MLRISTRPHVVRDGDSLEDLAERYLGSRSRWNEIYEANRELLSNPELLPIGKTLQIPRSRKQNTGLVPIDSDGLQALRQSAWPGS